MKLNILSDVHLSQGPLAPPATDADVVILAGDIARPQEAIAWACGFAKPVLYVPGNHEFYGGSIAGTLAELRRLSAGTCIRVLDDDELVARWRALPRLHAVDRFHAVRHRRAARGSDARGTGVHA